MGDIIRSFCSEDGFYMRDLSNLNHELGNLSLGDWPKDYLHQFLLQAQGWEFSCYSIASACRCLHKLELSLFREGNLSIQPDVGMQTVRAALSTEHSHLPSEDPPSSCSSMFVFRRFFARATSLSVTLVHSRILEHGWNGRQCLGNVIVQHTNDCISIQ